MRGLRTPMDQLQANGRVATTLAERFAAISKELEDIATVCHRKKRSRTTHVMPGHQATVAFQNSVR
jgi:hypothetical protein